MLSGYRRGERPVSPRPALVFLGRSNVGKSTLLNRMLGTAVARVSATPGRTQALFWYRVDERLDLIDCPGYGFARVAKSSREEFSEMLDELLTTPPVPQAAALLIDGRLPPQALDRSMALFLLERRIPAVVVATKWDAVRGGQRVARLRELVAEFGREGRPVLPVSAETGENLAQLVRLLKTGTFSAGHADTSDDTTPTIDHASLTAARRRIHEQES